MWVRNKGRGHWDIIVLVEFIRLHVGITMKRDIFILSQIYGIITQEVNDMGGKVCTYSINYTSLVAGWTVKYDSFVPTEDIRLIGMSCGQCASAEGHLEFRTSKGVSDPSVDLEYSDAYFHSSVSAGAGGAGSGAGALGDATFLPPGHYFEIDEDEPIFFDMFARAIGDGGTVNIYYVKKRDWKK